MKPANTTQRRRQVHSNSKCLHVLYATVRTGQLINICNRRLQISTYKIYGYSNENFISTYGVKYFYYFARTHQCLRQLLVSGGINRKYSYLQKKDGRTKVTSGKENKNKYRNNTGNENITARSQSELYSLQQDRPILCLHSLHAEPIKHNSQQVDTINNHQLHSTFNPGQPHISHRNQNCEAVPSPPQWQ